MQISLKLLVCSLCFFASTLQLQAQTTENNDEKDYTIIFTEFENSSAGQYEYLTDSIVTMLASRLASGEKITVLDKEVSSKSLASLKKRVDRTQLAEELQADFLISGGLYAINTGLNIQVALYPLFPDGKPLRFSITTDSSKSLITDVDKLSQKIARDAFGRNVQLMDGLSKKAKASGESGFITEHPEAAYKKRQYAGAFSSVQGSGLRASAQGAQRNIEVPVEMIAMTIEDLDSDGQDEVLILSRTKLQLYGLTEDSLELLGSSKLPKDTKNHAINVADINSDGVSEIYISGTKGVDVSSTIMTWDKEAGFSVVATGINWYLRPALLPNKGIRLLGQQRGFEKIEFVRPGIYELELSEDYQISKSQRIALPPKVNLFDFVWADLDGNGAYEIIVIDRMEKMRVYNASNQLLWVSKRSFGGSSIYLGPSQGDAINEVDQFNLTVDEEALREPIFVPSPLIVQDFDLDGSQEIIVNENESTILNFFHKLRIYDSSLVVGLHWNGEGMQEIWRTGKYSGVIAAYSFSSTTSHLHAKSLDSKEFNPTGMLYVGQIPAKGSLSDWLPGELNSELKVYELEFAKEASE